MTTSVTTDAAMVEQQLAPVERATAAQTTGDAKDITEATNATIAKRVAQDYKDRMCYVRSTDKAQAIDRAAGWLHFKRNDQGGGVWTREGAEKAVMEAIDQTIRAMLKEAGNDPDTSKVQQRTRDLLNALNRLPAIKQVATYYLDRPLKDFNRDPYLLNVQNGTLDLRALHPKYDDLDEAEWPTVFRKARAEDLCSKQVQACWEPGVGWWELAPRWTKCQTEWFGDDPGVTRYVQRACGYSLLGANPTHAAFICYGGGGNGKSTMLDTITDILGGYAGILSPDVLVSDYVRSGSSLQPELTAHRDTRMIVSSEPKKGVLNSHRIKSWTGDSQIQLRRMYGEPEIVPVTFTLWLMTNVLPDINELTLAVERRMHLIPFSANFVGSEDRDLKAKLWEERNGILWWLLEGLTEYYEIGGLNPPESILQAARDWYQSETLYTELFNEVLTRGTGKDRVLLSDLTEALTHYVLNHEEDFPRVVVNTKLVNDFTKTFGLTKRTVGGQVYVYGIKLGTNEFPLDVAEDRQSYLTAKEKLYVAVCEGLRSGRRTVYLAEETGLAQKSCYVILKRMVDEGLMEKRGAAYVVVPSYLNLYSQDEEERRHIRFVAQLAWKLIREEADECDDDEMPIDATRLGERIGLASGYGKVLLHAMAEANDCLTETTYYDQLKGNVSEFTYHRQAA